MNDEIQPLEESEPVEGSLGSRWDLVDLTAPRDNGTLPSDPAKLPHGLVAPPPEVLDWVTQEKAKFPPQIFTPEAEQRLAEDCTLQYYYEGFDVAYRRTERGLEVLAVGLDEVGAYVRRRRRQRYSRCGPPARFADPLC